MQLRYTLQERRLLRAQLERFRGRNNFKLGGVTRGIQRSLQTSKENRGWATMSYWEGYKIPLLTRYHICCGTTGRRRGVNKCWRLSRGVARDFLVSGKI